MRNLVCVQEIRLALKQCGVSLEHDAVLCLDNSADRVFFVRLASLEVVMVHLGTGATTVCAALVDMKVVARGEVPVSIEYLMDVDGVVVLFRGGDLVHVPLTPSQGSPECVGSIDSGAVAMAWSPDGELVVVATGNATLFCLSKDWLPVAEVPLRHVTDTTPLAVEISWEGDGNRFATNTTFADSTNCITLWSRACVQLAVCESQPGGTSGPVAFRPTGFLVATAHKSTVALFESNGLRHGGWTLDYCARAIAWSPDASLVALLCVDMFQIWRCSNYTWQLCWNEQVGTNARLLGWSQSHTARVVILTSAGLRVMDFIRDTACSSLQSQHTSDPSMVCVVAGKQLRVTLMRIQAIPPPMSFGLVELPFVPCSVASHFPSAQTLALSVDGRVCVFDCVNEKLGVARAVCSVVGSDACQQIVWASDILALILSQSFLVAVNVKEGIVGEPFPLDPHQHTAPRRLYANPETGLAVLLTGAGKIYTASVATVPQPHITLAAFSTSLPECCVWVSSNRTHLFAQSARNRLYAINLKSESDDGSTLPCTLLEAECTSFAVHNRFVLMSTLKSKLRFASVDKLVVDPVLDREIDTGTLLVCCIPGGARVVLQAPRGNLEVRRKLFFVMFVCNNCLCRCSILDRWSKLQLVCYWIRIVSLVRSIFLANTNWT
jgi:hypothetical protein